MFQLIDAALKDARGQFMVESVINRFRGTGGVTRQKF